jgi:Fe(3+) dicitrate transport protein
MFKANPRMATRSRNYYSPDIHIPSFTLVWKPAKNTRIDLTSSAVLGARNSVLFDRPATVADTLVSSTLQYNNRQVDIDRFNSYNTEIRLKQEYTLFGMNHT